MSIERIFHCDVPECERHVQTAAPRPMAAFLFITEGGSDTELHFCSWDCVLKYAAAKPPAEVVLLEDD